MEYGTARSAAPAVCVVIVSDYAAGEERTWSDLRRAFSAWAAQDFDGAVEHLLVEDSALVEGIPKALAALLPGVRTLSFAAASSYELKNRAVASASAPIVAIADADCVPGPSWLSSAVHALRSDERAAAVSGRTSYPDTGLLSRVLSVLDRGYLDPGRRGETRFIGIHAVAYRREAYTRHPLPEGLGAFASRIQSEALLRAGFRLLFEPAMKTLHAFDGWPMEGDIRRNIGFSTVATRLADGRLPWSALVRLGPLAVPLIAGGKFADGLADCLRCGRLYGVPWYALPYAFAVAGAVSALEVPGMLAAFRQRGLTGTAYR